MMQRHAFSLVELSIVLVILGLLTGGILAGQSLIRAAELRAVPTEYNRWVTATQTFRDKYFGLPGDFRDATKFWGFAGTAAAPGCISNSGITAVSTPGTCDGNGNGALQLASANEATGEIYQYWKQLALAGLVEGQYSGLAGLPTSGSSTGSYAVPGSNVPRSKLSGGAIGWTPISSGGRSGNGAYFDYPAGMLYVYGRQDNDEVTYNVALRPEEVWNIDTKMDDGRAGRGKVMVIRWQTCTMAATSADLDAEYRFTNNAIACAIQFNMPF